MHAYLATHAHGRRDVFQHVDEPVGIDGRQDEDERAQIHGAVPNLYVQYVYMTMV